MANRMDRLVALFHHRWAVPVLAELHAGRGAKFVTLQRRLGASREAMRAALDDLAERGFVARNPGYGHPLRPEYVLTAKGRRHAPACARLVGLLRRLELWRMGLRKWPLLVTLAIRSCGGRFNDLKAGLPGITARALTMALKALQAAGVVERRVTDDYPPRAEYCLTRTGSRLAPLVRELLISSQ